MRRSEPFVHLPRLNALINRDVTLLFTCIFTKTIVTAETTTWKVSSFSRVSDSMAVCMRAWLSLCMNDARNAFYARENIWHVGCTALRWIVVRIEPHVSSSSSPSSWLHHNRRHALFIRPIKFPYTNDNKTCSFFYDLVHCSVFSLPFHLTNRKQTIPLKFSFSFTYTRSKRHYFLIFMSEYICFHHHFWLITITITFEYINWYEHIHKHWSSARVRWQTIEK